MARLPRGRQPPFAPPPAAGAGRVAQALAPAAAEQARARQAGVLLLFELQGDLLDPAPSVGGPALLRGLFEELALHRLALRWTRALRWLALRPGLASAAVLALPGGQALLARRLAGEADADQAHRGRAVPAAVEELERHPVDLERGGRGPGERRLDRGGLEVVRAQLEEQRARGLALLDDALHEQLRELEEDGPQVLAVDGVVLEGDLVAEGVAPRRFGVNPGVFAAHAAVEEARGALAQHRRELRLRESAQLGDRGDARLAQPRPRLFPHAPEILEREPVEKRDRLPFGDAHEAVGLARFAGELGEIAVGGDADGDVQPLGPADLVLHPAADLEGVA